MRPSDDDSLLGETLANEAPPDLRSRLLARIPEKKAPASRRFRRLPAAGFFAAIPLGGVKSFFSIRSTRSFSTVTLPLAAEMDGVAEGEPAD